MFKFESFAAYVPELEVRGPQALATTATTSTKTETKENENKASLEIKEDAIEDNEETVLELLSYAAARKILKTTPEEGDEGFEGPPFRQSLEEDDASEASGKQNDDASDASKDDIKILDDKVEDEDDIESLSTKAEIRARQGTNAWVPDPVMNDLEKVGTVNTTLEDGELKVIVAPEEEESKDTSANQIKTRILGPRIEEGRDQKMSGYRIKQLITSLSDKADDATTEVLSEKAE